MRHGLWIMLFLFYYKAHYDIDEFISLRFLVFCLVFLFLQRKRKKNEGKRMRLVRSI